MGPLLAAVDQVIEGLGAPDGIDELTRAREEFAEIRGKIFEDEELWESWTQAMLEWCAVERPWRGGDPVVVARLRDESSAITRSMLEAWSRSLRTLAEVLELSPGRVLVRDLIGGGVFGVDEDRELHGVEVGDVAELRLIGYAGHVRFGRTFCFHPRVARDAIADRAAAMLEAGRSRAEIVDFCAALRLRCERYRHVAAERIYADG